MDPAKPPYDFMGKRHGAMVLSLLLLIASVGCLAFRGLHLGLDFTGGTQALLVTQQPTDLVDLRTTLASADLHPETVQPYGSSNRWLLRFAAHQQLSSQQLRDRVEQRMQHVSLQQVTFVGPQMGSSLLTKGVLALVVSLLATMAYIALRFDVRFAGSAAVALLHDPVLILGCFAAFQWEFNLISLAALLTVVGYSLNDTIVVYDRVRENFRKLDRTPVADVMNLSITQTLSRTLMTSGLTSLVVVALLTLGGDTLRGFAAALLIGIVVGTYSSIYVAGALAVTWGLDRSHFISAGSQQRRSASNRAIT